MRTLVYYFFF